METTQDGTQLNELARMVLDAHRRVRWRVRETPLEPSPWLSSTTGCHAYLKLESEQHTGSFKARGAINKLMSLPPEVLSKGLVTCSTGNHALAFLYACSVTPAAKAAPPPLVYLPATASAAKVARLRARGADVVLFGDDCVDAEAEARRVAAQRGLEYVSPYNDMAVMAGQGTVALELLSQLPDGVDAVFVPVGGGGLIGGIAALLKALAPACRVYGCQPAASDIMRRSVAAGVVVQEESAPTLSDATAGGVEEGTVTLHPCIDYVDEWVTLSEQEIADAMASLLHHQSKLVEGAAACALAALLKLGGQLQGKHAVVVCCGGNVSLETLRHVLAVGKVLA